MREKFAYRKNRARQGGIRSQQVQDARRLARPLGPRPLPKGRLLRTWINADHVNGQVTRYDVFASYSREGRVDVQIDGGEIRKNLSVTKLTAMMRRQWAHRPCIVED